ncbi:MAG: linear amide C-N hydrolase [Candidatus Amulumruptor caecigallinarius]|nr:linear amide C-N hydrolase [Candidatus Amulumruptor caecigallinarius]MCM1396050.1 linear amide C-N hydrolase [Candidatus Amulumruptor caecigallinarius]MCM1453049.1 linear amide C-N hydrolase [bacterium]
MNHTLTAVMAATALSIIGAAEAPACTGITLRATDGSVVAARTVEWAGSRYESQAVAVPRGYEQQSYTSRGQDGMKFKARYGFVGLSTALPQFIVDGLNEHGLCAELFFFPGSGKYPELDSALLDRTIGDMQLVSYLLGECRDLAEVKEAMKHVRVTALEPSGSTCHWRLTDASGKQIVMEIIDGEVRYYDSIGVLTNAPEYTWHLTNLRNYINLYSGAAPSHQFDGIELTPLSGGSGLLGLPGDYTSPSRFVRAAFFQDCAPAQATGLKAVEQAMVILNNFDIPIGTAWAKGDTVPDMHTSTQWAIATDLKARKIYYRTGINHHIRCIDVAAINFAKQPYKVLALDDVTSEPVTPVSF